MPVHVRVLPPSEQKTADTILAMVSYLMDAGWSLRSAQTERDRNGEPHVRARVRCGDGWADLHVFANVGTDSPDPFTARLTISLDEAEITCEVTRRLTFERWQEEIRWMPAAAMARAEVLRTTARALWDATRNDGSAPA